MIAGCRPSLFGTMRKRQSRRYLNAAAANRSSSDDQFRIELRRFDAVNSRVKPSNCRRSFQVENPKPLFDEIPRVPQEVHREHT
jgi:hypothetical protein